MKNIIFPILLTLFDGAASGAGAAGATGNPEGGTNGSSANTQQRNTGEKILYGKQTGESRTESPQKEKGSDAGSNDERNAKFRELITKDYKDLYDAEVQRIIGKRFRETKSKDDALSAQKPILDQLCSRYGTAPGDMQALQSAIDNDNAMWEQQAEEAGMSVEQFRKIQQLQRQNAELQAQRDNLWMEQKSQEQLNTWIQQAEELKQSPEFSDFDLSTEINDNPEFLSMLKNGISVGHAYSVLHLDRITGAAAKNASAQTEKAVTANIRARGTRPSENGASAKSGVQIRDDPSKWTKDDVNEVIRRVSRGEKIVL